MRVNRTLASVTLAAAALPATLLIWLAAMLLALWLQARGRQRMMSDL